MEELDVQVAAASDVGRERTRNEDAYLVDPERGLLVVADGMGGHPAGDRASRLAVAALDRALPPERLAAGSDRVALLRDAICDAHEVLLAAQLQHPELRGMRTTLVVTHVDEDAHIATVGHVGDSRAYLVAGGRARRLTNDHVWRSMFGRTLTQAVGASREVDPDVVEVPLDHGDVLLLCTDGLTDLVDEADLPSLIGDGHEPDKATGELVDAALERGGHDNVTVVVAEIE